MANNLSFDVFANIHERSTRPKYKIFVLRFSGLTNFWGCTFKAYVEALIQKFSAGNY